MFVVDTLEAATGLSACTTWCCKTTMSHTKCVAIVLGLVGRWQSRRMLGGSANTACQLAVWSGSPLAAELASRDTALYFGQRYPDDAAAVTGDSVVFKLVLVVVFKIRKWSSALLCFVERL